MPFDCSQLPAAALKEEGPKEGRAVGDCGGEPREEKEEARVSGAPKGVEEGARACAIMSDSPE